MKEDDDASRKRLDLLNHELGEKEREYNELEEVGRPRRPPSPAPSTSRQRWSRLVRTSTWRAAQGTWAACPSCSTAAFPSWRNSWISPLRRRCRETSLLRNRVTDEEIADVLARWTGIPVARMLEGEREAAADGRSAA